MIISVSWFKTVNYVRDYHRQNYEHLDKTKIMITYIATRKSALLLHKLGCFQERVKLLPISMVSSLWLCIITRRSLWLCIINRRLCGCALSLVVFVVVHYHLSSLWLCIITRCLCGCALSLIVFVVVHYHSSSLWLCIITRRLCGCALSLAVFVVVHYHSPSLWLCIITRRLCGCALSLNKKDYWSKIIIVQWQISLYINTLTPCRQYISKSILHLWPWVDLDLRWPWPMKLQINNEIFCYNLIFE